MADHKCSARRTKVAFVCQQLRLPNGEISTWARHTQGHRLETLRRKNISTEPVSIRLFWGVVSNNTRTKSLGQQRFYGFFDEVHLTNV